MIHSCTGRSSAWFRALRSGRRGRKFKSSRPDFKSGEHGKRVRSPRRVRSGIRPSQSFDSREATRFWSVHSIISTMLIRLKKNENAPVLTCIRDDGSTTWSKMPYREFFPRHDLMHYAVETTLGFRQAFFGLIASGWSIESFTEPGAAKQLTPEAKQSEFIVEQLERKHRFGEMFAEDDFNTSLGASLDQGAVPRFRPIAQKELDAIRTRFEELLARYAALPDGKQLELKWKPRRPEAE